jgi:uncharacterized repeat protein (TIGR03803 family)
MFTDITVVGPRVMRHLFQLAVCAAVILCGAITSSASSNVTFTMIHDFDGAGGDGSIYRISPNGKFTSVYSFEHSQAYPFAGLVRGANGTLYWTTYEGGSNACGGFFCGMVSDYR